MSDLLDSFEEEIRKDERMKLLIRALKEGMDVNLIPKIFGVEDEEINEVLQSFIDKKRNSKRPCINYLVMKQGLLFMQISLILKPLTCK